MGGARQTNVGERRGGGIFRLPIQRTVRAGIEIQRATGLEKRKAEEDRENKRRDHETS